MRKLVLIALVAMLLAVPSVKAGTGTIRIDPALPVMVLSPATFTIWVQPGGDPTASPNILLVMTEASWNGLSGNVVVAWSGAGSPLTVAKAAFTSVTTNSEKVPDSGTTNGARYTVASLKDHLSTGLSVPLSSTDTIYWVLRPFLSGPLTGTPQAFTITFTSTDPRALVYAIGKTGESEVFNNKVPPTIPGFVVPELGPVLLAMVSFGALAIYAIKRKKTVA